MQKNEERVGRVLDTGFNGEGILREEGQVVFVPFAIAGELIRYKILKVSKKCVYGKLLEVIEPSNLRVEPKCPVYFKCGGCSLSHIKYSEQIKIKEKNIVDCFYKIANLKVTLNNTICGDNEYNYRNKLQLPVGDVDGQTVIGFYAENSHRIIPIDDCLINPDWTKAIIKSFKLYIEKFSIKGYNEQNNTGELREITVKEVDGNLIITAVSLKDNLRKVDELIKMLQENLSNNFSFYLNINKASTNVIYGNEFKLIYGEPEYYSNMLGIKYPIGVRSFMQVNTAVCYKLYSKVKELAKLSNDTVVIDAYSGAGLMTAVLAKDASKAIGVEIIGEAVDCANKLAILNGLSDKISNYQGKCEVILPDIIEKITRVYNDICLVLDPPRRGCDLKVIEAVINSHANKIIYVSCLPSSLARDVGLIMGSLEVKNGEINKTNTDKFRYEIESITPFEMFPQTKHVETVVCLNRKD